MKKLLLLIFGLILSSQTIKAQVVLDTNGISIKWTGGKVPSPYFIQASPRGTLEWFAIVSDATKSNITYYAKNIQSGRNFFTPQGSSNPIPFNNIVTSLITNMDGMFTSTMFFNHPLGSWDVSKVTSMAQMFSYTNSFNQPIGSWNVGKVTNMDQMFAYSSSFNQPIGSWNVSKVTNMNATFVNAFSFNQPIGSWNVSNVINMQNMFYDAKSFNQPLGNWNVSKVTNMSQIFLGAGLSKANYDSLLIGWSTIIFPETPLNTGVSFSAGNSKYCKGASARSIIINTYGWNITDGGFDCSIPNQIVLDTNGVSIKWTGLNVPSPYLIQASPRGTLEWFAIVDSTAKIYISDYAKNIQSGRNFFTPPGSSNPIPFNNIVTSLLTNLDSLFYGAGAFNQPIESWDVSKVSKMQFMFSLAIAFNQNISSWNMSKVTNMENMFLGAGLSFANYDTLLIGWSTIIFPETPLYGGVTFSAGNSKYCKGASARSTIINSYGWTITDGGFDCTISGVEELEESKLKLYPNPVESILNVAIDYHLIDEPYVIIDGLGKVVLKGIFKEVESAINLKELSKGIYYLRVSDSYSSKFMKE